MSLYSRSKASVARHIRDVGRLLTATELRSADRYWHVRQDRNGDDIYPIQYEGTFLINYMIAIDRLHAHVGFLSSFQSTCSRNHVEHDGATANVNTIT